MWFELALFSMLFYGILDFLFKVVDEHHCDLPTVVLWYYSSGCLLALLFFFFFFFQPVQGLFFMAFLAAVQVSFFLVANALKLESLKFVDSVIAFPLFGMYGVLASVMGMVFLHEVLHSLQLFGVFLSVVAILLLLERRGHLELRKGGVLALVAAFMLAVSVIIAKIAASQVNIPLFIAFSYFFAILPSYLLEKHLHKRSSQEKALAQKLGIVIGAVNVLAFLALMFALQQGPAAVILPIVAVSILISIVLSKIIYHEHITKTKILALALAVIAFVLVKLGTA